MVKSWMDNVPKRIWNEEIMAYFEIPSWQLQKIDGNNSLIVVTGDNELNT
jgi:hypothetical protein